MRIKEFLRNLLTKRYIDLGIVSKLKETGVKPVFYSAQLNQMEVKHGNTG